MKRHGKLFEKIVDIDNIRLAFKKAQKGKSHYTVVRRLNKNPEKYIKQIQNMLVSNTFTTGKYKTEKRLDSGKLRTIHKLPYFPDRIVQHAIMNIVAPIWKKKFIRDTFQSIEGRGTHEARKRIESFLRGETKTHAIKIDVEKFYPSVNNSILKTIVESSIKCKRTLMLLFNIIDSHMGLPIGNYTSQYLGNLYLTCIDWWAKQVVKLKGYFRYCDDILIFHSDSKYLKEVSELLIAQLDKLKLRVKENIVYRHVQGQGIDFCGFVFFGAYTRLRKRIKFSIVAKCKDKKSAKLLGSLMAYWGWVKRIDAKSFWRLHITKEILRLTDEVYLNNPLRRTM